MVTTVRARVHQGATSLDLTIPASMTRRHGIKAGDVFEVTVEEQKGQLILKYRRVYSVASKNSKQ